MDAHLPASPPADLSYIGFHAARGMYQYRDSAGRIWEGHPSNVYGTLRPIGTDSPASPASSSELAASEAAGYFPAPASPPLTPRSPASPPLSASLAAAQPFPSPAQFPSAAASTPSAAGAGAGPMTHFPDTWDPPAGYEVADLPSRQRLAHKFGMFRKNAFHSKSAGMEASSTSSEYPGHLPRSGTWGGAAAPKPSLLHRGPSAASALSAPPVTFAGLAADEPGVRKSGSLWSRRGR